MNTDGVFKLVELVSKYRRFSHLRVNVLLNANKTLLAVLFRAKTTHEVESTSSLQKGE